MQVSSSSSSSTGVSTSIFIEIINDGHSPPLVDALLGPLCWALGVGRSVAPSLAGQGHRAPRSSVESRSAPWLSPSCRSCLTRAFTKVSRTVGCVVGVVVNCLFRCASAWFVLIFVWPAAYQHASCSKPPSMLFARGANQIIIFIQSRD